VTDPDDAETAMATVKIAVPLPKGQSMAATAETVQRYEAAGVDVIAVPEAYGVDAVSRLGYLAAVTRRVELMAQILPIYSRTPALTAMTAAGLDQVSDGRFILGLGVSGPQVIEGWHGVAFDAPLGRTREIIEICRLVWRRERLEYHGRHYRLPLPAEAGTGLGKPLKLADRPVRAHVPIFVAALGPANVELAATVADGWIPFLYIPERADRVWGTAIARGTAKRCAELGPLQVVAGGPLAIGADLVHLRERERDHLALYVGGMGAPGQNFYNQLVAQYGFEAEAAEVQRLYLAGHRAEAAARVPEALLEGISLIGDEGYLRDRLAAYVERGVTILQVDPIGPDPIGDLRRLGEILAAL
jgi:F420-dependent oxidoreductase-like protein